MAHDHPARTPRTTIPRVDVLGVGISAIDMRMAVEEIARWVERRESNYVCVTGVHGVMASQRDPELRDIHDRSGLTTPDGMPIVWAGRWAGMPIERVYGPDLMLAVCGLAATRGWRNYLYGGKPGVASILAERLQQRFPGLVVAGTCSPPFRPLSSAEEQRLAADINAANPDILWVGLSTPKQERWMAGHVGVLQVPALIGVGAAFDIHAGLLPQAPRWMQRSGLEWSYRLAKEPRRLWRRYLYNNPRFVASILRKPPRARPVGEPDEPRRSRREAATP